ALLKWPERWPISEHRGTSARYAMLRGFAGGHTQEHMIFAPTRPVRSARRVRCESTRDRDLSGRAAHRGGGNDSSEWHSASDTELVPIRWQSVDLDHPHNSAQI